MTYPISFRRHVLAVKEREGLTFSQAAERFAVGIASLVRWSAKLEPKEYKRARGLKIDLEMLAQDVRDFPDAYQYERAGRFGVTPKAFRFIFESQFAASPFGRTRFVMPDVSN